MEKLVAYIYRVRNIRPERLVKLIAETVSEEKGQVALTIVGKMEQEAEQRGKLEGKLEVAREMMEIGYPLADILKITGLSREDLREAGLLTE